MKGRIVILDQINDQPAAALMEDGILQDLLVDLDDAPAGPGTIFRATVDRQMKGQGGVFLTLPDGERAFLRQSKGLAPGQSLLVQVTGYAEPGKGIPVTPRILFKSRYAIITPGAPGLNISRSIKDENLRDELMVIAHEQMADADETLGLILRSACATSAPDEIADDIANMRSLAQDILAETDGAPECLLDAPDAPLMAWRDWADKPAEIIDHEGSFADMGVLDGAAALWGGIPLPGGGSVWVEPTRALVAVDVNTGGDTSPAAGLKANMATARDLPRILRLRGLAGQIVIDFAPMPKKDRRQLEQVLKAAFRNDPVDTILSGWTNLGNFELQRKRERLPLPRGMFE